MMSCMAPVVLSDVFGVEITEEDEKMLRGEYQEQKERYGGVQEYFEKKKLHDTAGLAQSFYILYMGQVLSRPDTYLADLAYCFEDAVKLRNISRIRERFGLNLTEEDMNVIIEYARDTHIPTENYRTYKNSNDLAKFARYTVDKWKYRENTAGDILTVDQIYKSTNMEDWFALGSRTADNTGIYKAYLWLNHRTGNIELTTANTLLKSWTIHAGATVCGAIIGAQVPIALTSRFVAPKEAFLSLAFCAILDDYYKKIGWK